MIDRRNQRVLAFLGLLLIVGGGLSAALGAGVFGSARANRTVFDSTVVRWWDEGGWESFAVVTVIGAVVLMVGAWLALAQLRSEARPPLSTITFPRNGSRGVTALRPSALADNIEVDLERLPDVDKASVRLFGSHPDIEMHAVLTLVDDADLASLPTSVDDVLARAQTTTGVRPHPVQVTLRFKAAPRPRLVT